MIVKKKEVRRQVKSSQARKPFTEDEKEIYYVKWTATGTIE